MEQKFKPGDIVQLKSGGPSMTVRAYEPTDGDEVTCGWFEGNTLYEKAFHQDMLNNYQEISSERPIIFGNPHNPYRY